MQILTRMSRFPGSVGEHHVTEQEHLLAQGATAHFKVPESWKACDGI